MRELRSRMGSRTSSRPGALAAIGNTPLVRLDRCFEPAEGAGARATVFAKLELLNPMGSSKDRAAASMLLDAMEAGQVRPGETTVIESTSGNAGVALAWICKLYSLPLICVVDRRITPHHRALLQAFGVTVDEITTPDPKTGELLPARLARVRSLLEMIRPSFWPNQYGNIANARAHLVTCAEIHEQLGTPPDYIFCATGTCGTLRGCADYVRSHSLRTELVAVDAAGSAIFGDITRRRLIPGLGSAIRPPLVEGVVVNRVIRVTEEEAVSGSRRLLQTEAILAGGSSGAVISAVAQCEDLMSAAKSIVVILPDSGERYLDTIYDDAWVAANVRTDSAIE